MLSSRDRLLQHCTVKLVPADARDWGTGFWVTPHHILTCAHVVEGHGVIPVWWRGQAWGTARVAQVVPLPVDLALLQVDPTEGEQPPSVLLGETFNPFDRLYVYGYPDDFPDGGSVTIQCEGAVQEQGVTLIKAQAGQVRPGHSGSPALNWETGQVCGVVSDTRSRSTDLGGLLIPVATVFSHFRDLPAQNQAAHPRDSLWWTLPLPSLAASPRRAAVPPPQFSTYNPATFAGRVRETATLSACLKGGCRILAITGMTGIGKTALAERVVAEVMAGPHPQALWAGYANNPPLPKMGGGEARPGFPVPLLPGEKGLGDEGNALPYYRVSLDTLSLTPDFASSGAALLRVLGEEPTLADQQDPANLVEHILQRLHHQPYRVQIDSLERLLRGNEQEGWSEFCDPLWLDLLQRFLAGTDCPSQLLLTSQDIPGDLDAVASRYPQFWHCEPLQGLNPDEQRTLFQNLGLTPTDTDWELLQPIGAFYDGHPLVLQVIAEEIRQRPFQGNIRQYWHHYEAEFTTTAPATATKLDRSRLFRCRVRHRVEQTIQRLPTAARQLLCASAVFRRPVPVAFWQAMLPDGDPQPAFDTLADRGLVEYAPTPSTPSPFTPHPSPLIRQHNLIRSVAYALLKADPSLWKQTEERTAEIWLASYKPAHDASKLERLRGYIEAFSHYCNVENWQKAESIARLRIDRIAGIPVSENYISPLDIQRSLWGGIDPHQELHEQLGLWGCCQEQIYIYESLYKSTEPHIQLGCLNGLGYAHYCLGKYPTSKEYFQQALTLSKEQEDNHAEKIALTGLGYVYYAQAAYGNAHFCCQELLNKAEQDDDVLTLGRALGCLGKIHVSVGDHKKAIEYLERYLERAEEFGAWDDVIVAIGDIAVCHKEIQDYQTSLEYNEEHLKLAIELGNKPEKTRSLINLSGIYSALGHDELSMECLNKALNLSREIGDLRSQAVISFNIGREFSLLADHVNAKKHFEIALDTCQKTTIPAEEARILIGLTLLCYGTGQNLVAKEYCSRALALARRFNLPLVEEYKQLREELEKEGWSKE